MTILREQEPMASVEDTEITLGVGKLLGLFFCLVILCGLSLGIGYWLGRGATKQAVAAATAAEPANPVPASAGKPQAAQVAPPVVQAKAPDCGSAENCPPQTVAPSPAAPTAATPNPSDLTFYKAVQQKDSHPQLTPPEAADSSAPAAAEARHTLGTGYLVQIAAVRNQDDAKLLSNTLQKQQYPAIITQPGDKLFHVQVGPYADIKEAEAIRARLVGAGYNAFLKH
jgi:DedD protein